MNNSHQKDSRPFDSDEPLKTHITDSPSKPANQQPGPWNPLGWSRPMFARLTNDSQLSMD